MLKLFAYKVSIHMQSSDSSNNEFIMGSGRRWAMVHAGNRQRASIVASYLARENLRHMMKKKNSSCHQFNRWYGTMAFLKMKLEVGFWTREKSEALCCVQL